ncbi:hypothetical protein [Cricetibacter osteomyelitidis]|nr:hypothetical protein [Cricetibacter osteomyelitidis]
MINSLSTMSKGVSALLKVAKNQHFRMATFDLMAEIIIPKHMVIEKNARGVVRANPKQNLFLWRQIYEVNPITKNIVAKAQSEFVIPSSEALQRGKYVLKTQLIEPNYKLFHILGGLDHILSYEAAVKIFSGTAQSKTLPARFTNDPFVGILSMIAGQHAPPSRLEQYIEEAKSAVVVEERLSHRAEMKKTLISLLSKNNNEAKIFGLNIANIKRTVISGNTALSLFSALVEFGIWSESNYKDDRIGQQAAMLRGFGGLTFDASLGILGMLAADGITGLAVTAATTGMCIGGIALVVGLIMGLLSEKEIEIWIRNGFWGNSKNYWGEPDKGYEWKGEKREEKFLVQINTARFSFNLIENNVLFINPKDIYYKYTIEMQRYFQFASKMKITALDKHHIVVSHPSLNDAQVAAGLIVKSLYFNKGLWECRIQPEKTINLAQSQVILTYPEEYPVTVINSGKFGIYQDERFIDTDIQDMRITVSLPDYQGSNGHFSGTETIKF